MTYSPRRALRVLAEEFGCDATVESIARQVYKQTECGCYFDIVGENIIVGTIVEGSDAEHTVELDLVEYEEDNAGDGCLASDVNAALVECEIFVEEQWHDAERDCEIYDAIYGDNGVDLLDW
jgi:hypothetical protein